MSIRKLINIFAVLAIFGAAFVVQKANAAGIQATNRTPATSEFCATGASAPVLDAGLRQVRHCG